MIGIVLMVLREVDQSSGLHVVLSMIHSILMRGDMLQETVGHVGDLCMG